MRKGIFALTVLFSAVLIASCGNQATVKTDTADSQDTQSQETAAETETSIYDSVETPDLGGYTFHISNNLSNFAYQVIDIAAESGETLDDAIYRRNREVESALNITISVEDMNYDVVLSALREQVLAGDTTYDLFFDEIGLLLSSSTGYLADMSDVSTIHYDNPWWNEEAMDSIEIDNRRLFLFNDIDVMFYECYSAMMYNKQLASSLDINDLYDKVDSGKWTLDEMKSCILLAATDLNGDGVMDEQDQYGFCCYESCNPGFFIGSDTHIITKDAEGTPVWNGVTEQMTNVYLKIVDSIFSNTDAIMTPQSKTAKKQDDSFMHTLFHNGQSLFYLEPLGSAKKMRDADFEIGILPMPKYDEEQEGYHSYICVIAPAAVVPTTSTDLERTGTILEVMAAYSNKYVRPAYFDSTLNFKYAHDEESVRMLDMILTDGEFELSLLYNWGTLGSTIQSMMLTPKPDKWVSTLTKMDSKIQKAIAKTLEAEE